MEPDPRKTERWSWIMWFVDSETCQDHSIEWFKECSDQGHSVCQELYAGKVPEMHDMSYNQKLDEVVRLNTLAAEGGSGEAAIKIARAYLNRLPTHLPFNPQEARRFYELAVDSHDPEGYYGLAEFSLMEITFMQQKLGPHVVYSPNGLSKLAEAVEHLEQASYLGHVYSMINLGLAHLHGYVNPEKKPDAKNYDLAESWFVASGLPEGLHLASLVAAFQDEEVKAHAYSEQAKALGYGQPWRAMARQHVGSGGAAGVDLNLPWPKLAQNGDGPMKI